MITAGEIKRVVNLRVATSCPYILLVTVQTTTPAIGTILRSRVMDPLFLLPMTLCKKRRDSENKMCGADANLLISNTNRCRMSNP